MNILTNMPTFGTTENILKLIKTKMWENILDGICKIKDNTIIIDFIYFKHFATNYTYDMIMDKLVQILTCSLINNEELEIHLNMKGLTVLEIEKHSTFFQKISSFCQTPFTNKLNSCYVYNTPFVFSSVLNILSLFIDKETINKIKIVKTY